MAVSVQEIVWHILDLTGMTQTELAKRSGIPQANISRFLKGNTTPKRNTLTKLANGLSVTEDELTGAAPLRYDKDTKAVFPMPTFQNELEWAASDDCNVAELRRFIFENPTMPLVVYGNGGNYSTAFYFASLYSSYKGLARAMSCFECSTLSDKAIKNSKHLIITGSGTSMDAKYAVKRLIGLNAKNTGAISKLDYVSDNGRENLVKKTIEKKNPQNNFDYNYQGHEQNKNFRGHPFIGLSSVVAKYAMIYKAFTGKTDFTCLNSTAERLEVCANDEVSAIPNLSVINRFVVLYGSWSECVAKDIECKLVESSLGSAVITDYRNFCHGKFTISSNFKDLAVVLLITPRERKLAQQIRNFRATPHDISIISIETEYDSPLAAIDLLIKSSAFIYQRAEAVGRHPLKTPPTPSEVDVRFPKNGVNYEQELKRIGAITLSAKTVDWNLDNLHVQIPNNPIAEDIDKRLSIFLAGPNQGGGKWRTTFISKFAKQKGLAFYNPKWSQGMKAKYGNFDSVAWESKNLNSADIIVFWIPSMAKEVPDYAKTTRTELGEYLAKGKRVIIGIDDSFNGKDYLIKKANEYGITVLNSFGAVVAELSRQIKQYS